MRLAIISDIHGNLHALEAVLRDLRSQGADEFVVNGDMVNRGPNNVAVLERLLAEGCVLTLGNHDDLIRKWVERDGDLPAAWFEDPFWEGTAWVARQLEEAGCIAALRDLPMTHKVTVTGAPTLLISHGSPRHYREGYGKFLSDADIAEIVQNHPADILIGSHTHRAMVRRWADYRVLNTGAVGAPFNGDPRAQYLLMTLSGGDWQADFRAVSYDREGALAAFEGLGYLPAGELSAHIFREELRLAKPLYAPFWMWTEAAARSRTWQSWRAFCRQAPDRFDW
ncbi:MAG: metallophosphoesterase [Deinococcota bacterium]|jgi:predicted phosphodiesterase|nr:metallophosphoesterase [Deinococcota bacterium]